MSEQPYGRFSGHLPYFTRYAVIGAGNFMVDMGSFAAGVYLLGWSPVAAKVAAYVLVVLLSFFANKRWTFGDRRGGAQAAGSFARFILVNLAGLALATGIVWSAVQVMAPLLANLIAIAIVVVFTYLAYRYWVYRPGADDGAA
ncbi:MAG: GtrA family protein [Alphaproteobacteria bacterium]|nr:GtrA family protein [Alphaproteobacteria bacterium]